MSDTFTIYETIYDASFRSIEVKAFQSRNANSPDQTFTLEDADVTCTISVDFARHKSSIEVSGDFFEANIAFSSQILISFARLVEKTHDAYASSHLGNIDEDSYFRIEDTLDDLPSTFEVEYV